MDPIKPLDTAPETTPYQRIRDGDKPFYQTSCSSWRGRKISAEQRLQAASQKVQDTSGKQLKARLEEHFGTFIKDKVAGKIAPGKALNARKVAQVEHRARKMLTTIQADNRKKIRQWIKDETSSGMVARQFEYLTGYRWSSVDRHERQLMVDQARTILAQATENSLESPLP